MPSPAAKYFCFMSSRDSLHAKVRAILEKANHPNTPQAEAETALALAYRMMAKYDLDENLVATTSHAVEDIVSKTFTIKGPYRVRRGTLLWNIANAVSCHAYRDMMEPNPTQVIMVAYGTANDLFTLEALYTAADLLAARSLPSGDRRFRTSWWRGYCEAIGKKLSKEYQTIVKESPGIGLVLVERAERARRVMVSSTPHLRSGASRYRSDKDAFGAANAPVHSSLVAETACHHNDKSVRAGMQTNETDRSNAAETLSNTRCLPLRSLSTKQRYGCTILPKMRMSTRPSSPKNAFRATCRVWQ